MLNNILFNRKNLYGIIWMVLASLSLSVMAVTLSNFSDVIHGMQIFFLSSVFSLIYTLLIGFAINFKPVSKNSFSSNHKKYYLIRGVVNVLGMVVWFAALQKSPVTEITSISYLTPLFNVIAAVFILKERFCSYRLMALVLGMLGAYVILKPEFTILGSGTSLALLTAIIWSTGDIITKTQIKYHSSYTQCLIVTSIMMLLSLPFAALLWANITISEVMIIMFVGLLQFINFYSIFSAYKHADLVTIVPFDFSRLLFTAILAYILFGEVIDFGSVVGAILILISSLYLSYKEIFVEEKS
jgi:drug/metabolite transporter (DMT)-like permease